MATKPNFRGVAKEELTTLIEEFPDRPLAQSLYAIISFIGKDNIHRLYEMDDEEFYSLIEKVIVFEKGE